jgi:hypothetical protein
MSDRHQSTEDVPDLRGNTRETLLCLFLHGPTWDGDVPSKSGRDELVHLGLASRGDGYQWLTDKGARLCLRLGYAKQKERRDRQRRNDTSRLEAENADLRKRLETRISIIAATVKEKGEFHG